MAKRKKYKFSIEGKPLYPHIKLTRERFPRILATRIITDDDAEYFGAFLNRTSVRLLIDFLNRIFKLRSCEIDIDGTFNYPCTMYYKRRCLAPCVADIINEDQYNIMVGLLRLFLRNDREMLLESLTAKIRAASDEFRYEIAAKWSYILAATEEYWADSRHAVWLDGSSDTFQVNTKVGGLDIFLISQKGKRVLGERSFSFEEATENEAERALSEVIRQVYVFHAPKEIRVARDLPDRAELQTILSEKFGRHVPIVVVNEKNRKISTELAVYRSTTELDLKRSIIAKSPRELMAELKSIFVLPKIPKRVSAVDVSHISGTNQVAAAIAWENGKSVSNEAEYSLSGSDSELETLSEFVNQRYRMTSSDTPELLIIDGGRPQLNAALSNIDAPNVYVISAVKPPKEHSEVSHFLTADRRFEFNPDSDAHRLLQRLRDEVHEYANSVHRDTRDFAAFYQVANMFPSLNETERQSLLLHFGSSSAIARSTLEDIGKVIGSERAQVAARDFADHQNGRSKTIKPLVIPIRFQEENGAADDLRPIAATHRK